MASRETEMMASIADLYTRFVARRDEAVVKAAIEVVQTRYSDKEWDDLDRAIGELCGALQDAGVDFKNPRIGQ